MKKIWIAFLIAFSIAFAGCKKEAVAPDPEIVTFDVLPGTSFTSGDIITVNFEARNAVSTENNIGAPTTTSWSYTTIATLNLNKITVTAVNLAGKKVTATKSLIVVVPYIPDRTDSICSMVWSFSAYDNLDKDGNIVVSWNLQEAQKTDKFYYYKDGTTKSFSKNGTLVSGPYNWKWTGSYTILNGDQTYRYKLDDTKLYLYQSSNDGSEIYRQTFTGVKI